MSSKELDHAGAQQILKVRAQARHLHEMAWAFMLSAVVAPAAVFPFLYDPIRSWKLGHGQDAPHWELVAVAIFGGLVGFGLSLPFCRFFQVQAGLVQVQLLMEENTRAASEEAAKTSENIRALTDATLTGEWRPVPEHARRGDK